MKIWLSFSFLVFSQFSAAEGGMVGNGGDAILQEFNLRGRQLAEYFKAEPGLAAGYGVDPEAFLTTVKKTKLEGEDQLFLNGQEVDAINYPQEFRIQVSRTRWRSTATRADSYFVQRRIALHEYLWIYGINDEGYRVSNPIILELEKAAGTLINPDVRNLFYQKFCYSVARFDFVLAQQYLSWGLDINDSCPNPSGSLDRPIQKILFSYRSIFNDNPIAKDRLKLVLEMLKFGLDPNQLGFGTLPMVFDFLSQDLELVKVLFDHGADPNWTDYRGNSLFALVAGYYDMRFRMTPDFFALFLEAGGDVNFCGSKEFVRSPARAIVSKENNTDMVEALIKTGQVDWCDKVSPYFQHRTIDEVLPEYEPLLKKYHVECGRFLKVLGKGKTCSAAQANAQKQCADQGFKRATFDPYPYSTPDGCGKVNDPQGPEVWALYHCTDN